MTDSRSKVTPSLLASIQTPRSIHISPSGKYAVYALRTAWMRQGRVESPYPTVVSSLWLAEVGKINSARQLTPGDFNDSAPSFSPDGKSVTFLSDRAGRGKANHLYSLPIAGSDGDAMALTDTKLEKGVGDYKWSPTGKYIALSSPSENDGEKAKKDAAKDDAKVFGKDWEFNRLRLLDVERKAMTTLFEEDAHVAGLTWSPNGGDLAFVTLETPTLEDVFDGVWTIRTVNLASGHVSTVCEFVGAMTYLTWRGAATGDGELLWLGASLPASANRIYSAPVPAANKRGESEAEPQYVAYGEDSSAEALRVCNGGMDVVAYVMHGLRDQLHLLSPQSEPSMAPKLLFSEETDISKGFDVHIDADTTTIVCVKGSLGAFEGVYSTSIANGSASSPPSQYQLSEHNAVFASLHNASASRSIRCNAPDGVPLEGIFYLPNTAYTAPYPLVVNIRGGPYYRATHSSNIHFEWTEYLLSLGYAVLLPNYRGGCARGAAFAEMTLGQPDAGYEDVMALVKCVVDEEGSKSTVDRERVAVVGYSWGGYLTNLCVTRQSGRAGQDGFRFKAAVSGAGISCLQTMALTTDISHWLGAMVGTSPWDVHEEDDSKVWYRASPIHQVSKVEIPVLLMHPEQDERVPKEQSVGFYRGMAANGKKELCELVLYPREGHGHIVPWEKAHYEDMLTRIGDFLEKHLKGGDLVVG